MSPAEADVDVLALVGVHAHDAAEPLLAAGPLVVVGAALDEPALVDPHEGERPVRVLDDLEGHGHGRPPGIGDQREFAVRVVVGQGLGLALQRATASSGPPRPTAAARPCCDRPSRATPASTAPARAARWITWWISVLRHRLLGQEQLQQFVAVHRQGFEHLLPGPPGLLGQRRGNRLAPHGLAVGTVEIDRLLPRSGRSRRRNPPPARWGAASAPRRSRACRATAA